MSETVKAHASTGAWIASEVMSELISSLEETSLTQAQRQEITQLALRAFDGTKARIEHSLAVEEQLRAFGMKDVA